PAPSGSDCCDTHMGLHSCRSAFARTGVPCGELRLEGHRPGLYAGSLASSTWCRYGARSSTSKQQCCSLSPGRSMAGSPCDSVSLSPAGRTRQPGAAPEGGMVVVPPGRSVSLTRRTKSPEVVGRKTRETSCGCGVVMHAPSTLQAI